MPSEPETSEAPTNEEPLLPTEEPKIVYEAETAETDEMYSFVYLYAFFYGQALVIGSVLMLALLTYGVMVLFSEIQVLSINSVNNAVTSGTNAAGNVVRGSIVPVLQD